MYQSLIGCSFSLMENIMQDVAIAVDGVPSLLFAKPRRPEPTFQQAAMMVYKTENLMPPLAEDGSMVHAQLMAFIRKVC